MALELHCETSGGLSALHAHGRESRDMFDVEMEYVQKERVMSCTRHGQTGDKQQLPLSKGAPPQRYPSFGARLAQKAAPVSNGLVSMMCNARVAVLSLHLPPTGTLVQASVTSADERAASSPKSFLATELGVKSPPVSFRPQCAFLKVVTAVALTVRYPAHHPRMLASASVGLVCPQSSQAATD